MVFWINSFILISIHTPHAGSDEIDFQPHSPLSISIHTPHAGSDIRLFDSCRLKLTFQSTLPMRGATSLIPTQLSASANFNPHSPCGERRVTTFNHGVVFPHFNPHSPCGERLFCAQVDVVYIQISIHTPHAGSDVSAVSSPSIQTCISIHTPHAGSDAVLGCCKTICCTDFNPHSPCGERHVVCGRFFGTLKISIHTPHAGSDDKEILLRDILEEISIHTPHAGSDVHWLSHLITILFISIHTPHAGSDSCGGSKPFS